MDLEFQKCVDKYCGDFHALKFICFCNRRYSNIEEWMAYLKDSIIKDDTKAPGLQEARSKLNIMKMTTEEYKAYRNCMVSVRVSKDAFDTRQSQYSGRFRPI